MKFWEAMKALEKGKKVRPINKDEEMVWIGPERSSFCISQWAMHQEWEVAEEPERTLSFSEVIQGLKEGRKFKRTIWKSRDSSLHLERAANGNWSPFFINEKGSLQHLDLDDLEAADWAEVKE